MTQIFNKLQDIPHQYATIVEVLRARSSKTPHTQAFTFLEDGETLESTLNYHELDRRSRAIAAQLQTLGLSGERALLLYPPGLDYLTTFLGCLYAGVVAVPAYPPHNQRNTPRVQAIISDAQTCVALTTTTLLSKLQSLLAQKRNLEDLQWLTTDNLAQGIEDSWEHPAIHQDSLAFLQYTSGSTGIPKGVMVSHGNLLHNSEYIKQAFELTPESVSVTWLPSFHDMGLIDGIIQPLYTGFLGVLMPPGAFIQRPIRWLQAISRCRATHCGGPNFAYELCVNKITLEQRETLDLSSWRSAYSGAEPIRQETLEKFAAFFKPCGFQSSFFYPCYGMAEATLMVSGGDVKDEPIYCTVQAEALEQNQVVEASENTENVRYLVGCGRSWLDTKIVIAEPESLTLCASDRVGEIWVSGSSVARGYWNRKEETEQTFHVYLRDTGEGPFLRTGDLGFLHNGDLFITGRAKDLIIIRGRNLYPQDIELTAERSHSSLRSSSNAVFSVEVGNEERLIVVQELEFRAKPNIDEAIAAIRQTVTEEHEVEVYAVVLIKPGSICKTSSGKIQRRATKADFLAGKLDVVGSSILKTADIETQENRVQRDALLALTPQESQLLLESYLVEQVARVLSITPQEVNSQQPLSTLGLDSLKVFELKNRIEVDLEVTVSIADFFEGLSARSLSIKILALLTTEAHKPSVSQVQKTTSFHPLSFAQQRLWFINQLALNSPVYNIPIIINLTGHINVVVLEKSLNEIIRRHEVLRTNFVVNEGRPVQVIKPAILLTLSVEDLQEFSESERTKEVQRLSTLLAQQSFDLSSEPLWRAKLLHLAEQEHRLLLTLHHIIADGWSTGILIKELAALYEAFSQGRPSPLPELPIQYVDFTYWQHQWLQSERIQPLLEYWKQQLGGDLPVLNLPTDRPRLPVQTFNGAQARLALPQALTQELKKLSHQEGVTLFMTLLAAFKTLLYRYTGQIDILVGSPIASRNRAEIESLIGFFVNVLVLRSKLDGKLSFRELLFRVKSTALEAYVHQDLPFGKLVEELQPERDLSYNPLFQVMFVLQNMPLPTPKLSNISIVGQESYSGTAKFDLTLFMEDSEQGLVATGEYNTDLFNADTITRMLGHFQTMLEGIIANPNNAIVDLPLLTASEKHQLIVDWNDTKTDYPCNQCIHQLFEQEVERTPNSIAVVFENQQLTYRELNNQANRVAHYLQKLGVKPEVLVGICMERSLSMVVGLLGILKAGGAYLPLDPAYPKERLAFMLADAQVTVLLTKQSLTEKLPTDGLRVVCLDTHWEKIGDESSKNSLSKINSDNLAYAIYTSGSTGKPKGVAIEHRSASALLGWAKKFFSIEVLAGVLATTSICFDLSVFEIFVPLSYGGKIILVENALHLPTSSQALEVTLINTVPSVITELLSVDGIPDSVHTINLAGEPLQNKLVQQLYKKDNIQQVVNLYGPSEDTTYSTFALLQKGSNDIPPIGCPIANTEIYLLDRYLQPVPVGVPGELYIGGTGLARGYLNRSELTALKFIPNPFSKKLGARLYKTGDLARYRGDGTLEFLGRIDHQVKIRGHRIELGEIEETLGQHPEVQETVVLMREDTPGNRLLVAYFVAKIETKIFTDDLRHFLRQQLPDYLVPSAFVQMKALPLTTNNKVDRRALPVPDINRPELTEGYQAPRSKLEQTIATVWQELLHLEKVGVNDNFFDLGGHSLLMVQVNNKLQEILHKNLLIVEMFQNPTINSLAQYLSQKLENTPSFQSTRHRVHKQIEAINRQKQQLSKQGKKIYE
ncbi:amino acid adenylation domain-containing protein [Scytonema sp. NUACC26]|uniref:amino acid adenylation domain-containing protein n=1 Tax=Scytonema sp. NUACC26 TaxID=3140176 RepID=UPI0034DBA654